MAQTEPQLTSYGELARRCLYHPDWPEEVRPKERSLAALFSKFDRDIELEWLVDRVGAQVALSRVLGCPLSSVERPLRQQLEGVDAARQRFRFWDAPELAPLELREEQLPPGFPEVVQQPANWDRVLWSAPRGCGVELVGEWLRARGLAHVQGVKESLRELRPSLLVERPLLLLYAAPPMDIRAELAMLATAAPNDENGEMRSPAVIIALPLSAAELNQQLPDEDAWRLVQSPSAARTLEPLAEWFKHRLAAPPATPSQHTLQWLTQLTSQGVVDGWETLLGLLAIGARTNLTAVPSKTLYAHAEAFIERRLNDASAEGGSEANWLRRFGSEALLGLAERCLIDSELAWDADKSQQTWMQLVPTEFEREVDAEWTRFSLSSADSPLSPSELDRALADVPPGAFRVVRALISCRLLERVSGNRFRFVPRWLSTVTQRRAEERLLLTGPGHWGEALLHPHSAESFRATLERAVAAGTDTLLESLLELEEEDSPALVAALGALLECVGLSILSGRSYDVELLESLLEAHCNWLLELDDGLYEPRLVNSNCPGAEGRWLLAAWSVSELAGAKSTPAYVNPWNGDCSREQMSTALNRIHVYLKTLCRSEEVLAAHALCCRAAAVYKNYYERGTVQSLEHPLLVPLWAVNGQAWEDWRALEQLESLDMGVAVAEYLARDIGWDVAAEQAWRLWHASGAEGAPRLLSPTATHGPQFWQHIPESIFVELVKNDHEFAQQVVNQPDLVSEAVPYDLWPTLLSLSERASIPLAKQLPERHLASATTRWLQLGALEPLGVIWRRFPDALLQRLEESLTKVALDTTLTVLQTAPAASQRQLVERLSQHIVSQGVSTPHLPAIRGTLIRQVKARNGHWRASYSLLSEIERRLKRVAAARGSATR